MSRSTRTVRRPFRRAFTLVEMLIAMALTLILVYAIAEFYAYVGDSVKDGRATIVLSGELRGITQRLTSDLDQRTFEAKPWADDGAAPGYLEFSEGAGSDFDPEGDGPDVDGDGKMDLVQDSNNNRMPDFEETYATTNLLGDCDDILAFTIRTDGVPFRGRLNGTGSITASAAEVIWFTTFRDENGSGGWNAGEPRFLCRRLLVIQPNIGLIGNYPDLPTARTALAAYWQNNDVSASVRPASGQFVIQANTLADLTRREYRFAHQPRSGLAVDINFPNLSLLNVNNAASVTAFTLQGASLGEDIVLSNLLAFDVRAFDPSAPLKADAAVGSAQSALQPGDLGWPAIAADSNYPIVGYGAYVDLYYNRFITGTPPSSIFSGPPVNSAIWGTTPIYDTWATSYEHDGIDQFNDGNYDRSTNGLDDTDPVSGVAQYGVDDPSERETSPPYPVPLRGIEIRVRIYEPSTRQSRQATVVTDFLPE